MPIELSTPRAVALILLAATAACPRPPEPQMQNRPVVTVDGRSILAGDLRRELWRLHGKPEPKDPARIKLAEALLEHMIDEDVVLAAARQAGVTIAERELASAWESAQAGYQSRDFKDALYAQMMTPERLKAHLDDRLTVEKFLKERARDLPRITDEMVRAHFEQNRTRYHVAAQVRARQILVRTPEEAELVVQRLKAGEDFARVAREHSVAPEKERGGDLGYFGKGTMPEVFDRCFQLEPGQISDVVGSEYGQHIFLVTERRPEQEQPLEAVTEEIREALRKAQTEDAEAKLLAELKGRAVVTRHPEVLLWAADAVEGGSP